MATWIQYKAKAFKYYKMNFLFFEFAVDLLTTVLLTVGVIAKSGISRKVFRDVPPRAWSGIVYAGAVGICASQTLFCLGLTLSEASYTSLYMMLTPSVTSLLAILVGLESRRTVKVLPTQLIGISIALLGTVLMITLAHVFAAKVYFWSSIYLVLHVIAMASNVLVWRKLFNDYGMKPLQMTWLSFLVATPTMFVVLLIELSLYPQFPPAPDSFNAIPDMLGLIYIITVAYTINYSIMAWCIRHSAITIVSVLVIQIYVSARPMLTTFISIMIHQNVQSVFQGMCVTATFAGLVIATIEKKREKRQKENDAVRNEAEKLRRTFLTDSGGISMLLNKTMLNNVEEDS